MLVHPGPTTMVSYGTSHRSEEYLTKIGYQGDMKFGYCWFNYKNVGNYLYYYHWFGKPGKFGSFIYLMKFVYGAQNQMFHEKIKKKNIVKKKLTLGGGGLESIEMASEIYFSLNLNYQTIANILMKI